MVEGVNMISKHTKPNVANPQGEIPKSQNSYFKSSLLTDKTGKPTKIGRRKDEKTGKLIRFAK